MNPQQIGFAPGTLAIWFSLVAGIATCLAYYRALRLAPASAAERRAAEYGDQIRFARSLYLAFAGGIFVASALLLRVLLSHDFRISYVASYSGLDLPLNYLFSTFWAGQEGSFLLWLFFGGLIGFAVIQTAREQEPQVMIIYVLSFLGIVAILAKQPPFRFLAEVPPDGQGLNPLLQDPWMVIHPPVMFAGFASLSVPFAFAIGALWSKRWDGWVVRAMPWALFSMVTLGTAILMGGYWAYKTLGWGGYWAWDPVENTSLVPWLATVALVHGMFLQKNREKHRKINLILAILAFCCILYGTFLTRSGVLADFSVHSFVDLGITGWLVAIIGAFFFGGLGLLAYRWREIPKEQVIDPETGKEREEPFLSRSVLFILSVTLFCASGIVILLGTSAPILTRMFGKASQVATSFYNVTHTPVAAIMVLLISLVPFITWRGEAPGSLLKKSVFSLLIGLCGFGLAFAAGVRKPMDLLIIGLSAVGLAASAEAIVLYVRRRAIRSMGGYLSHAGTSIMIAGILISGVYEEKAQVTLPKGQPIQVGTSTMTFTRTVFVNEDGEVKQFNQLNPALLPDRRAKQAMEVEVKSGTGKVWKAYPKMYQNERTQQLMANPDVRSTPLMDLYLSPQSYDPGSPARQEGTVLKLEKGIAKTVDGVTFKFIDFSADKSQVESATPRVTVTARLLVSAGAGPAELEARFVTLIGASGPGGTQADDVAIPGTEGRFRIRKTAASEGVIEIEVLGLNPGSDLKPATPESFSVDVTRKPLISLVWTGFYIMMAGGILALFRRMQDANRASLA